MNEISKQSLVKALSECALKELPNIWDGKNIWIRALAKVKKYDGSESFVMAKNIDGKYRIVKDFGTTSAIHSILEYYPYEYLESCFIPQEVKFQSKDIKINAIKKEINDIEIEELEEKSIDELNKILTNIGVENQKNILGGEANGKRKQYTKNKK